MGNAQTQSQTRDMATRNGKRTVHVVHLEELVQRMDAEGKTKLNFAEMTRWYGGEILLMYQGRPWGLGVTEVARMTRTGADKRPDGVALRCLVADADGAFYSTCRDNPPGSAEAYTTTVLSAMVYLTERDLFHGRAAKAVAP